MPYIRANNIDINYERRGSGPRLVFINGTGATLATTLPMLDMFAARFDVLAYDQRGLGETIAPEGPYSMADYAADALALTRELGWDTFRLLGVSFGGMVAQEVAVTAPERIERLALMCTSPGGAGGSSYPLHTLESMTPDEQAAAWVTILDTRFTPEWLAEHEADRMIAEMVAQRPKMERPEAVRRGERLQLEARAGHDVYERLPRVTCPTLVASGTFDGIAAPDNGRVIAEQIPNAEFRLYEGGHIFFIQDQRAYPEVLDFLAAPV